MNEHQKIRWQCLKCGKSSNVFYGGPKSIPSPIPGKCPGTATGEHIPKKVIYMN